MEKAYCPSCAYETIIETGKTASDYKCSRHDLNCVNSGEKTNLPWLG